MNFLNFRRFFEAWLHVRNHAYRSFSMMLSFGFLFFLAAKAAVAADIALDIGHSLKSPGAVSASGIVELELNKRLAKEVAVRLDKNGIRSQLIGEEGKMDVLTDRTEAARGDRLFLSFHHDSVLPTWLGRVDEFSGFSLFVSRRNPRLNESLACARKLGAKLIESGFKPSRYHAMPVDGENRPFADEMRGVHYFDDLVVLKTAKQPAVLIEAGVIVNPKDEQRVSSARGRSRLADALAAGAMECLTLLGQIDAGK